YKPQKSNLMTKKWMLMICLVSLAGTALQAQPQHGSSTSPLGWLYNNVFAVVFGNGPGGSLAYALFYVAVFTLMAMGLYKKKIVIKL
ncbi:MAG: hypothetical protein RBQ92_07620, partial [Bacteroidales bacterium]|nr:hypothetical protein [Bacteroidales bacterium]